MIIKLIDVIKYCYVDVQVLCLLNGLADTDII